MLTMILHWVLTALILLLVANIVPGIEISSFGVALIAALVIGLVNLIVRPIVALLTLPINLLTLGLFAFVINAVMFAIAAWLVPGFEVNNFVSALIGSLLLAAMTALMGMLENRASSNY